MISLSLTIRLISAIKRELTHTGFYEPLHSSIRHVDVLSFRIRESLR